MNVRKVLIASLALAVGAIAFQQIHAQESPRVVDAASTTEPTTLPSIEVTIGKERLTLEVADDEAEQERGLMYRRSMPADHGMLFAFKWADVRSFWMQNTLIPLDIVYLDEAAKVLNVEAMVPLDESAVRSDGKAKYAIELNHGAAERLAIKRGDAIDLPAPYR